MADRSIMLVDDNDINRGILAEIFKDKYNIIEASDGSDFLTDWFAARTAGGEAGMCDMLSTPEKQAQLDMKLKVA